MPLPPWIRAYQGLQALQAGAGAGLHLRQQNISQAEAEAARAEQAQRAADTLQLHYSQLAQEAAQQQAAQEQARMNAAESLRQHQALELHRQAEERQAAANALRMEAGQQAQAAHWDRTATEQERSNRNRESASAKKAAPLPGPVPVQPFTMPDGTKVPGWFALTGPDGRPIGHPFKPEGATPTTMTIPDREDKTDLNKQITAAEKLVPAEVPPETTGLVWKTPNPDFQKYRDATNTVAKLKAQKKEIVDKYRPSAPAASKRIRVREKKTGKLGWWEGGSLPSEYEPLE